jgi:hypothetical protein
MWEVQDLEPAQFVAEKEPDRVRITTWSGREILLIDPWVLDGEIIGYPLGRDRHDYERMSRPDTVRVATSIVARIESPETYNYRTGAIVVAVFGLALMALIVIKEALAGSHLLGRWY